MANADAPFGFRVAEHALGGTAARIREYEISSAYATAIFEGDAVKTGTDGYLALATAADQVLGIFMGVRYTATDGSVVFKNNWVASTATKTGTKRYALVYDDPGLIFEVQSDVTTAQTDLGAFVDIVTTTAGNATTGRSGQQIGATGGAAWQVVGFVQDKPARDSAGNQALLEIGLNGRVYVKAVKHERAFIATAAIA